VSSCFEFVSAESVCGFLVTLGVCVHLVGVVSCSLAAAFGLNVGCRQFPGIVEAGTLFPY
jgi:hypothetical protein